MDKKITILLAEDHIIVRKGLKFFLDFEENINVLGEVEDGEQAVLMAIKLMPSLVILDIALPRLNGLEAAKQIKKINPKQKILILSAYSDDGYIRKAIEADLNGYLVKQCSPLFLVQAITEINNGNKFFSPNILERALDIHEIESNDGDLCKKRRILTVRENQILQMIAEGNANKVIAYSLDISIKTVDKHRQNLMKKLAIRDTAGLTRYALEEGIIENSGQNLKD
jgi:DNA-binding NarL/FixJ family response regulator